MLRVLNSFKIPLVGICEKDSPAVAVDVVLYTGRDVAPLSNPKPTTPAGRAGVIAVTFNPNATGPSGEVPTTVAALYLFVSVRVYELYRVKSGVFV